MNSLEPKASSNVRKHFALAFSALATMLIVSESYAHIRITPVGRMGTLDRAKFIQNNKANPVVPDSPGPCAANTTRMATPLQVQGGSMFTFMVQETINHPGRFYVQFSNGGCRFLAESESVGACGGPAEQRDNAGGFPRPKY